MKPRLSDTPVSSKRGHTSKNNSSGGKGKGTQIKEASRKGAQSKSSLSKGVQSKGTLSKGSQRRGDSRKATQHIGDSRRGDTRRGDLGAGIMHAGDVGVGVLRAFGQSFTGRTGFILVLFVLLAAVIFIRLFTLTVVEATVLSDEGAEIRTKEITLSAQRGTIYDRNGIMLATDIDAVTIYANPTKVVNPNETAEILQKILGGNVKDYYEAITKDRDSTFVYIAKKVDTDYQQKLLNVNQEFINDAVEAIRAAGDDVPAEIITPLTGIEFLPDTRREYFKDNTGSQIIGCVDENGIGISGLEKTYDEILRGVDGYRIIEEAKQISQNTRPLPMIDSIIEEKEPVAGNDIIISIDIDLQQALELNLQWAAYQRKCTNASAILLDGSTGEIIATASIPLFNRERVTQEDVELGATNIKAITQPYEPGSTFKAVITAVALEQGLMTAEDTIYCPPSLQIYDRVIKDSVYREGMDMSLRQIVARSSNIGVSLIEQQLGDEIFYEYLTKLELGEYTHVDFYGETSGSLADVYDWNPVQAANIAFGQGLEVSLLQMARIYGAIANDGIMMQPHFLIARPQYDIDLEYTSTRVLEAQTARDLEDILRSTVTDGYGINADIPGLDVVGKTGTAEIGSYDGGYESSRGTYVTSFVGYIDNSTSNFVFMSSFEDPANYLDSPATKFFSTFMRIVATQYKIHPQEEKAIVGEVSVDSSTPEGAGGDTSGSGGAAIRPEEGGVAGDIRDSAHRNGVESFESEFKIESSTPRAGLDWAIDTSG